MSKIQRDDWGDGGHKPFADPAAEPAYPVVVPTERHANWGNNRTQDLEESYRIDLDSMTVHPVATSPSDLSPHREHNVRTAVEGIQRQLPVAEFEQLEEVVEYLPTEAMRDALRHELSLGTVGYVRSASDAHVAAFALECPTLVRQWGGRAGKKLGAVSVRWNRLLASLPSGLEQEMANQTLDELSVEQTEAFFKVLAG
jgi:hypothetical protein